MTGKELVKDEKLTLASTEAEAIRDAPAAQRRPSRCRRHLRQRDPLPTPADPPPDRSGDGRIRSSVTGSEATNGGVKRGDALSEGLGLPPSIVALEKCESWGILPS